MLTTGGTLTISDVDAPATFVAQTNVAGSAGYGKFSIDAAGNWTYTANSAHNEFVGGHDLYRHADGRRGGRHDAVVTVNILGTNDAAVIAGKTSGSVTEAGSGTPGTPTVSGTLTATDVDNPDNTFTAVCSTATASTCGYGTFIMTAGGVWTYTLNNANATVQALKTGQTLTDTFTVRTLDGTTQVVTVTINGSNDGATISGTATGTVRKDGTLRRPVH